MRWTFQRRLRVIVGLTLGILLVVVVVDVLSAEQTRRELFAIESQYVPLLDIGPAAQAGFAALSRSLQEAVSAQDPEALTETRERKDRLFALINQAPPIVDRPSLDELRRAINEWYGVAVDVSERLIRGEGGEELVDRIGEMQRLQRVVDDRIDRTLVLDRRRLEGAFTETRHRLLLASRIRTFIPLILTVIVAALAFGISRKVMRALHALSSGFERFGRGEFDEPIQIAGDDELAEAAAQANRMAASLKNLDAQLREQQVQLQRTNAELEAFSYSVSHDLRAPLRGIDGFSLALLEDYSDLLPEEGRDFLRRVRAAAQRMAQLIDDLLRLSRISRGEMHWGSVDLTALAQEVAEGLATTAPNAERVVSISEGLHAEGDAQLLRIALENLLGNAWKFASKVEHPRIEVGVELHEGRRAFYVRDNGAGFDMGRVSKLFMPFQRLHDPAVFPGTGIGLATVQRIVHRHGGQVWAEGAVGRGATFYFTLPSRGSRGERP